MVPLLETTMCIVHHSRSIDIDWCADGPIGPYVDAFKQHLTERRYAACTFASYLAGITHFARWARSRHLRLHRTRSCDFSRRRNYAQTSPAPTARTARRNRGRHYPHLSNYA